MAVGGQVKPRHEVEGMPEIGMNAEGIRTPAHHPVSGLPLFLGSFQAGAMSSHPCRALSVIRHPSSAIFSVKGPPPVPIPIGAPLCPGFRWAVRCHGSDEAGRVAPPVYYVRREGRLPRVSNTAGDSQYGAKACEKQAGGRNRSDFPVSTATTSPCDTPTRSFSSALA